MTESETNLTPADREMLRRLRLPGVVPTPHVDEATLAAYLDGRLTGPELERVEAALAADPALLDAVLELRASRGEAVALPPARVLERAVALAPTPARRQRELLPLRWIAAAAAVAVACYVGFTLGSETYEYRTVASQGVDARSMLEGAQDVELTMRSRAAVPPRSSAATIGALTPIARGGGEQ